MDERHNKSAVNLLEKGVPCLITKHRMRKEEVKGSVAVHIPLSSFFLIRKMHKQWMDNKTNRVNARNIVE